MIDHQWQSTVFQRGEKFLLFFLGFIPFCNISRSLPDPTFWTDWSATALSILWLVTFRKTLSPISHFPLAAFTFIAVSAVVALQTALSSSTFPIRNLSVAATLAFAFLISAGSRKALDAGKRSALLNPFCAGLILAIGLNGLAVLLRLAGYEVLVADIVRVPSGGRAVGLIGQPNHLGVLSAIALATAIYFYARGRGGRWVLWPVTAFGAMACAISGSRIGVLAWMLTMSIVFFIQHSRRSWGPGSPLRLSRFQAGIIVTVFIAVQSLWLARLPGSDFSETSVRTNVPGRGDMLQSAVMLWQQHPIFGIGYGNFAERRLHDLDLPMFESHATHAHNLFAQVLVEWGTVGALIVFPAVFFLLVCCWRALRSGDEPRENFLIVVWIVCLLAHSMVEYPLWYARWLFPFALMVGLLHQPAVTLPIPTRPRTATATLSLIGLVIAATGYAAWDYARSQALSSRLITEIEATGKARVPLVEASHIASSTLFPVYAQIMLARALPLNEDLAEEKLSIATRAMNAVPNAETIARQISFLVLSQKTSEASAELQLLFRQNEDLYLRTLAIVQEFGKANPKIAAFAASQSPGVTH